MNDNTVGAIGLTILFMFGFLGLVSLFASEPECAMSGCDKDAVEGSHSCTLPDMRNRYYGTPDYNRLYENGQNNKKSAGSSTTSTKQSSGTSSTTTSKKSSASSTSSKKKANSTYDSYDDGYNDIYEDGDYDWDRYYKDDEYATGVDDAMEDAYEEYGEDW